MVKFALRTSFLFLILSCFFIFQASTIEAVRQQIYDHAQLLSDEEKRDLETLAEQLGGEYDIDFIIVTKEDGIDVMTYTQDFYDELEQTNPRFNAAILTIDMAVREFYLAGFYKGEEYLDNERLDLINERITPYFSEGDYYGGFQTFLEKAHEYMGYPPGVNPESLFWKWWFQLAISVALGVVVVGMMAYHSGGRVTVTEGMYRDASRSKILAKRDDYIRTTVTKRRKPSQNSGGGGGRTGGGHSHSGSRGSF